MRDCCVCDGHCANILNEDAVFDGPFLGAVLLLALQIGTYQPYFDRIPPNLWQVVPHEDNCMVGMVGMVLEEA